MLQLKCPRSGKPVDVQEVEPQRHNRYNTAAWGTEVPCPYCGETHQWTSGEWVSAMEALRKSPDAARVLVEDTQDGPSATTLP
jgi:endogenous inhibitor of DNA gyrase (YacG/DUF329 family)